ncbi:MAG: DUF4159 domain-containing protein [Alphaproteobacteria bacterium]
MGDLLAGSGIAFATPWLLAALLVLPIIWWLLRATPPAPRRIRFPAIRLLFGLRQQEETPARTPWWLILLRLVLAALVIVALARPLLNPAATPQGGGPLLIVVDNAWSAARDWERQTAALDELLAQADRNARPVMLLSTADQPTGEGPRMTDLMPAGEVRSVAQSLAPMPWPADYRAVADRVATLADDLSLETVWLSDGILADAAGEDALVRALERLTALGPVSVMQDDARNAARLLLPPRADADALVVPVARRAAGPDGIAVLAMADDGRVLTRSTATLDEGATDAELRLELPESVRADLTRVVIEGETSAGASLLIDSRWRRRPVGVVTDDIADSGQPLLSEVYYLGRALQPYSEVQQGSLSGLLENPPAVLMLVDARPLTGDEQQDLATWIGEGGVLVRFAGPRLAEGEDTLVPVPLRLGDRTTGGAMSWSEPLSLAPFDANSPFVGLPVPVDIAVDRQVLAQPTVDLGSRTWARLTDGTPLVTAERVGDGWLVLFHVTANADWSNLPLSGLFVDMLRRIVDLSEGIVGGEGDQGGLLPPVELIDGFGRTSQAFPIATAIDLSAEGDHVIGPQHPPGYYGHDNARVALNLGDQVAAPSRWPSLPDGAVERPYAAAKEVDLQPWLLAAALLILLVDILIGLYLRGLLTPATRRMAAVLAVGFALALPDGTARAQSALDEAALAASLEVHLAYVRTGVREVDDLSHAGLQGLSYVLNQRTAIEPGEPIGVDPEVDELAFFPLIYWPVVPEAQPLSDGARDRINHYLRQGGVILFDTRDAAPGGGGIGGSSDAELALRAIAEGIDIPPLVPVPPDHVLGKAFYLLSDFPGRFVGGDVWIVADEDAGYDGVSSVIIGGNDWAGAWAIDLYGRGMLPVLPGGERQREMAFRFGVNLAMYALTGNYKADQVHIPAILERLGQ